jgi:putative DNA primase/helicase
MSDTPDERPPRPTVAYEPGWTDNIPDELKVRPQWVAWRFEWRDNKARVGKYTKTPWQARPILHRTRPKRAKADDPTTWATFDEALAAYQDRAGADEFRRLDGIGYEFSADDGYVGIDFDKCLNPDGTVKDWAAEKFRLLGPSYAEVSPSGSGVKAFYRGVLPVKDEEGRTGRRRPGYGPDGTGEIEVYDRGRYFAMTGRAALQILWSDQHGN